MHACMQVYFRVKDCDSLGSYKNKLKTLQYTEVLGTKIDNYWDPYERLEDIESLCVWCTIAACSTFVLSGL